MRFQLGLEGSFTIKEKILCGQAVQEAIPLTTLSGFRQAPLCSRRGIAAVFLAQRLHWPSAGWRIKHRRPS